LPILPDLRKQLRNRITVLARGMMVMMVRSLRRLILEIPLKVRVVLLRRGEITGLQVGAELLKFLGEGIAVLR
jgi:hypothetical protein